MFSKQTLALQMTFLKLFLDVTIFLKTAALCVGRSTVRGKGLACWALGSIPESATETLQDVSTSGNLHGSYHLYPPRFPPSVHWGSACAFLILFSGGSISVLEHVTIWKNIELRNLSLLDRFENSPCVIVLFLQIILISYLPSSILEYPTEKMSLAEILRC